MSTFIRDVRYAVRQFVSAPLFTATALLTLAIGIGGTTAIFSLMHAVMLRSLPVADPDRLYRVGEANNCCVQGGPQDRWGMFSFVLYERLKAAAPEFESMTAFASSVRSYGVRRAGIDEAPRPLRAEYVTGSYFDTLGIRAFGGRLLAPEDDQPSAAPAAVISYSVWQSTYGGDPSVVGANYVIEGHPFAVVGVAPPGFFGETLRANPPDLWLPLQQEPLISGSGGLTRQGQAAWLRVIGRLRPGATIDGMSARLTAVLRQWIEHESGYPAALLPNIIRALPKQTITVVPGGGGVTQMKERYADSLRLLLGVCVLVLLIACANVANLLLARGMARRHESALRVALGASTTRVVRQALVESILLGVGGGLAGLAVADAAGRLLIGLAFQHAQVIPISTRPSIPVLLFACGLSFATGLLFGTAPAWLATRVDPVDGLRSSRRTTGDRSSLPRKALLVLQAALSVVLVAGAVMLARSLANLERMDTGFETTRRIHVAINPPSSSYSLARLDALYRDLIERLERVPGVSRAAVAQYAPFTDNWSEGIVLPGKPLPSREENAYASWDHVAPGYFEAIGQRIVRGRAFTDADDDRTAPVAVVNETFARRFFPGEDPLEKHFGLNLPAYADTYRIIGVVRDAKYMSPTRPPQPMFFAPLAQHVEYPEPAMTTLDFRTHFIGSIVLVASSAPGAIEPAVRAAVAAADPSLTIRTVQPLRELVDSNFDQQRAVASLASIFGAVALVLAAVGLYGTTAYSVARRSGEIGVRMALGADRRGVIRLVLSGAFRMVMLGLVLGVPLAIGAGRAIGSQLYGVSTLDWSALVVALGSLAVCALAASLVPALRAAALDPMVALRAE